MYPCSLNRLKRLEPHLVSHIFLKILICCDIDTYAAVFQPLCRHLIGCVRDCRYYYVRDGQTLLKGHGTAMDDVSWVIFCRCFLGTRAFSEFLVAMKTAPVEHNDTQNSPVSSQYPPRKLSRRRSLAVQQAAVQLPLTCINSAIRWWQDQTQSTGSRPLGTYLLITVTVFP
jgi:hypothetical protein